MFENDPFLLRFLIIWNKYSKTYFGTLFAGMAYKSVPHSSATFFCSLTFQKTFSSIRFSQNCFHYILKQYIILLISCSLVFFQYTVRECFRQLEAQFWNTGTYPKKIAAWFLNILSVTSFLKWVNVCSLSNSFWTNICFFIK